MPKDTRRIITGIQLPEGSTLRTFATGEEDALEALLTPSQVHHLKEVGAIAGDWEPKATAPATLKGNRRPPSAQDLSGAAGRSEAEAEHISELQRQIERLTAENEAIASEKSKLEAIIENANQRIAELEPLADDSTDQPPEDEEKPKGKKHK